MAFFQDQWGKLQAARRLRNNEEDSTDSDEDFRSFDLAMKDYRYLAQYPSDGDTAELNGGLRRNQEFGAERMNSLPACHRTVASLDRSMDQETMEAFHSLQENVQSLLRGQHRDLHVNWESKAPWPIGKGRHSSIPS